MEKNVGHKGIKSSFFWNPRVSKNLSFYGQFSGMREVAGVHHMKVHVFDDDIMITGANLSNDYFTDRQD